MCEIYFYWLMTTCQYYFDWQFGQSIPSYSFPWHCHGTLLPGNALMQHGTIQIDTVVSRYSLISCYLYTCIKHNSIDTVSTRYISCNGLKVIVRVNLCVVLNIYSFVRLDCNLIQCEVIIEKAACFYLDIEGGIIVDIVSPTELRDDEGLVRFCVPARNLTQFPASRRKKRRSAFGRALSLSDRKHYKMGRSKPKSLHKTYSYKNNYNF